MSHHLFLLSPSDTPLYALTHHSSKPKQTVPSPLAANLPAWSTTGFSHRLAALSGASSATQQSTTGPTKVGAGQDRDVIHLIANASLDAVEDGMQKDGAMCVRGQRRQDAK
jgi:hypothetical protein